MNKTKRTLLISSIVMVLVLAVVLVSVTAAWFSIYASNKKDNIIIGSNTIKETVTIGEAKDSQNAIYPAIAKPGVASKGVVMPYGKDLLSPDNENSSDKKIVQTAQCAVFYFPINFIGAGDSGANDNRKTIQVSVESAYLVEESVKTLTKEQKEVLTNYLDEFNVEMELVSKSGDGESATYTKITPHEYADFDNDTQGDFVYYYQPEDDGKDVGNNLNMLIVPGTQYYVKATVYFNKVDEECEEILQYATQFGNKVQFTFTIKPIDNHNSLNLRKKDNINNSSESSEGQTNA